jgi:hypothetical protein
MSYGGLVFIWLCWSEAEGKTNKNKNREVAGDNEGDKLPKKNIYASLPEGTAIADLQICFFFGFGD